MEQRRSLVQFFSLFLMLSLLLLPLNSAVPLSRSVALKNRELTVVELSDDQILNQNERNLKEKMTRREIETNDYPGSGANPRHDPRSPGRA